MKPEILSNIFFNYSVENYTPGNILTFVIHVVDSDSVHITLYSCVRYAKKIDSKDLMIHKNALDGIIQSKNNGQYVKLKTARRVFNYNKSIHKDRRTLRSWDKQKTDPRTPVAHIYCVYEPNLINLDTEEDLTTLHEQEDLIDLNSDRDN
jgi:hypothetical protein